MHVLRHQLTGFRALELCENTACQLWPQNLSVLTHRSTSSKSDTKGRKKKDVLDFMFATENISNVNLCPNTTLNDHTKMYHEGSQALDCQAKPYIFSFEKNENQLSQDFKKTCCKMLDVTATLQGWWKTMRPKLFKTLKVKNLCSAPKWKSAYKRYRI